MDLISNLQAFVGAQEGMATRLALYAIGMYGVIGLVQLALSLLGVVWSMVRPSKVNSYGNWAVVTGATDGIGLAYCHEFAAKGLNVVLISRTQSRLDDSASAIKKQHPNVEVKTIQADFDSDCYEAIEDGLRDVPVGILVNNVGRSYAHADYLHLVSADLVQSLIRMNVDSTTKMTRLVLPGMIERKKGCIVNVASAAGVLPTGDPLYAVYSATKAYVDFFSRSLNLEYAGKGIDVQCQVPYFVTSKLSKIRKPSLTVPTPAGYAKHAVRHIGYGASVVPVPAHALQHYFITKVVPTLIFAKLLLSHHFGIRKRAYKKKEKESAKSK